MRKHAQFKLNGNGSDQPSSSRTAPPSSSSWNCEAASLERCVPRCRVRSRRRRRLWPTWSPIRKLERVDPLDAGDVLAGWRRDSEDMGTIGQLNGDVDRGRNSRDDDPAEGRPRGPRKTELPTSGTGWCS